MTYPTNRPSPGSEESIAHKVLVYISKQPSPVNSPQVSEALGITSPKTISAIHDLIRRGYLVKATKIGKLSYYTYQPKQGVEPAFLTLAEQKIKAALAKDWHTISDLRTLSELAPPKVRHALTKLKLAKLLDTKSIEGVNYYKLLQTQETQTQPREIQGGIIIETSTGRIVTFNANRKKATDCIGDKRAPMSNMGNASQMLLDQGD